MSETEDEIIQRRLRDLGGGGAGYGGARRRPNPVIALLGIGAICGLGAVAYLAVQSEAEPPLETAQPSEFQDGGSSYGAMQPYAPPAEPEPQVVVMQTPPPEPDADLLAEIERLQDQIEALQNAPPPVVEEDTSAADAIQALTTRIEELQSASKDAQDALQSQLNDRDRELRDLRLALEAAQLTQGTSAPLPGSTDEEERLRRLREAEASRLAELERRRAEEAAFQRARITSPTIAFGGGSGRDGALEERTFGDVTDFVLNGALPARVTQAEVIANPGNTVVQGTMIQAVTETALDSSLPGQIRAVISEDVHAFDGSRVLIPRGSRLIGRYRSGVDVAQKRVTIAWDRLVLPTNQTVTISSFGGDELGRSGVSGFVDTRFDERFGSAALISLISALPGAAAGRVENEGTAEVLKDVGDDFADSTDSVIGEYLSIGPVIHVEQGSRITVMVDRDLEIF
jgi:type IV secretion system protein VirB10